MNDDELNRSNEERTMKQIKVGIIMVSVLYGSIAIAGGWKGPFSEEDGPGASKTYECRSGIEGVGCKGKYCDNVLVLCSSGSGITEDGWETGEWFSEEDKVFKCDGAMNQIAIGMACKGKYCDEVQLNCASLLNRKIKDCRWYKRNGQKRFSEEDGKITFDDGEYLAGMKCNGKYCDDKQYYVCTTEKIEAPNIKEEDVIGQWVLSCSGAQKCENTISASTSTTIENMTSISKETLTEISTSIGAGYTPPAETGGVSTYVSATAAYSLGMENVSTNIAQSNWSYTEECKTSVDLEKYNLYGVWQWQVSVKLGTDEVVAKTCKLACTKGAEPPKGDFTSTDVIGSCWSENK